MLGSRDKDRHIEQQVLFLSAQESISSLFLLEPFATSAVRMCLHDCSALRCSVAELWSLQVGKYRRIVASAAWAAYYVHCVSSLVYLAHVGGEDTRAWGSHSQTVVFVHTHAVY